MTSLSGFQRAQGSVCWHHSLWLWTPPHSPHAHTAWTGEHRPATLNVELNGESTIEYYGYHNTVRRSYVLYHSVTISTANILSCLLLLTAGDSRLGLFLLAMPSDREAESTYKFRDSNPRPSEYEY